MVNSFPQWGRASKGANFASIIGSTFFTAGHSGFQVK